MTTMHLSQDDVKCLCENSKVAAQDISKFVNDLIAKLKERNDNWNKPVIINHGLVEDSISGSEILLSLLQSGKITLSLYLELYLAIGSKQDHYKIILT